MIFQPLEAARAQKSDAWAPAQADYQRRFEERRRAAYEFTSNQTPATLSAFRHAQAGFEMARERGLRIVGNRFDDTNYIFLSFVKSYLPVGLIGLVIGVIFSASMGSTSGEINSLATVSVVDIYRRYIARNRGDKHYLLASRFLTVFWGAFAVAFAAMGARGFGALIERVNIVGSLFYGGLLGVFVLAFFCKHVDGTSAFWGIVAGEAAIFSAALFTSISFLWYNVIGCLVVVAVALALALRPGASRCPPSTGDPLLRQSHSR
jgi:Na+/proline symporter